MMFEGIREVLAKHNMPYQVNYTGSIGSIFFTDKPVADYLSAKTSDTDKFADYFKYMLNHGVHLAPSQFEAIFISDAHTEEDIRAYLELLDNYLK